MSPHAQEPVLAAGKPVAEADKALILLHGRGASAESILPLVGALEAEDFAVFAPQAAGFQWYLQRFTAPVAQNEPYLSSALGKVAALLEGLEAQGIPAERVVIAGFSQGACLGSEFVARQNRPFGGLLVFSGGLIGTGPTLSAELYPGGLSGTPVFIGCDDHDPHVALERVQESANVLRELGADVTKRIYPGMGHTIIQNELDEAKWVLESIM